MNFLISQVSHKGGRGINEDRVGYCRVGAAALFVLADGMGGHPEGEVAAELAVQAMVASFQSAARSGIEDARSFLSAALLAAHQDILRYAARRGLRDSPRTTLVAALIDDAGCISWTHCGDSRLYLVREGALLIRTRDHSYVEQRPSDGPMARPGAQTNRNVLWTCLGSPAEPVFDLAGPLPLRQGDKMLLCSDGLWDSVAETELVVGLWRQPVEQAVPALVEQALRYAGARSDNVTALALEWIAADDFQATRDAAALDDMSDDAFAPTQQADDGLGTMAPPWDEASMDRSIAEINEAIQRAAARKK